MASEHNKFRFPSLTSEEAVANCKSMFGSQVALSVDDLMRPQVCEQFRFCSTRTRGTVRITTDNKLISK